MLDTQLVPVLELVSALALTAPLANLCTSAKMMGGPLEPKGNLSQGRGLQLMVLGLLNQRFVVENSAGVDLAWDLVGAGRVGWVPLASVSSCTHRGTIVVPGGSHGGNMGVSW